MRWCFCFLLFTIKLSAQNSTSDSIIEIKTNFKTHYLKKLDTVFLNLDSTSINKERIERHTYVILSYNFDSVTVKVLAHDRRPWFHPLPPGQIPKTPPIITSDLKIEKEIAIQNFLPVWYLKNGKQVKLKRIKKVSVIPNLE